MNMPAFTAEAALSGANGEYTLTAEHASAEQYVAPQGFRIGNTYCQCFGWGFPCYCRPILRAAGGGGIHPI